MQNNKNKLFQSLSPEPLQTINGTKFTRREIDTIACILSGKTFKTIASFLSVAPKTIETHARNIMLKLGCNSREGIITFIENSNEFIAIKKYYLNLLIQGAFEKQLQEISKLNQNNSSSCLIIFDHKYADNHFIYQLEKHLNLVGIKTLSEAKEKNKPISHYLNKVKYVISILPDPSVEQSQINETREKRVISELTQKDITSPNKVILLLQSDKTLPNPPKEIYGMDYIDLSSYEHYYFSFFEILKRILPELNLDKINSEFKSQYEMIYGFAEDHPTKIWSEVDELLHKKNSYSNKFISILNKRKELQLLGATILCLGILGVLIYLLAGNSKLEKSNIITPDSTSRLLSFIRSDLIIPTDSVFLNRYDILKEIEDSFKNQHGIQTIALVGTGGAGKTTIVRQYARLQKANVIWEVNAETKESLKRSFEQLAEALATTQESQKKLKEIQSKKNLIEREEGIIKFVKERLRSNPNWLLIFDNVEKFSDIQKYFPQDLATWGEGKAILTTRDSNIRSNAHVNNAIQIGELPTIQKLALFTKIKNHANVNSLTPSQVEETQVFLENIPPYPLDVSIAAYYLRATNISYEAYLEKLTQHDKGFADIQENLLKEAGTYTKTRYGIIILSLEHIIHSHKDFRNLLLFISLFDSQNIPKDLLDKYKTSLVVDHFIYTLKKHSLITNESIHSSTLPTISIHRSTQAIILAYLIKAMDLKKDKHFIEEIGTVFKNYIANAIDEEDFSKMSLLIEHGEMFLSHSNLLTEFVMAFISSELGNVYRDIGNYEKAKKLLEESIAIYRKNSYENHPWFARTLSWLGSVCRELGIHENARQLLEESVEVYKKNSYENHPWFARALGCLESVYRDIGNYNKAKTFLEQSVAIYKKNSYENHPWLGRALQLLGSVYRDIGDYEKAKIFLEQSLVIYKNNSFENHPWFARTLGWLGIIYTDLGDFEKAEQFLEQSVVIYKKSSYENHPWFALTLQALGNVYRERGNFVKAKSILENSLQTYEKTYSKDHVNIAPVIMNLGQIYLLENNLDRAEDFIKKALEIFQQAKHPESYRCLESLAELYLKKSIDILNKKGTQQSQVFKEKAYECLNQSLRIVKIYFPENSPHIPRITSKLKSLENTPYHFYSSEHR